MKLKNADALFFYIYEKKCFVGIEFVEEVFSAFYIYDKNLAVGVENLAFKDFGGKIFLHIAEKVPLGYRKWDDMLKRAASTTQNESI